MADTVESLNEGFSFSYLNENSFSDVNAESLDNIILGAFSQASPNEVISVTIDDSPETTNVTMQSGSVLPPSRWQMPTEEELEAIWIH